MRWGKVNFFTVVIMRLCFGFALQTVLITQRCFLLQRSASMVSKSFLLTHSPHQQGDWGCIGDWEETPLWQLASPHRRDILAHVESCPTIKAAGRRMKAVRVGVMVSLHFMESPACSWKVVKEVLGFLGSFCFTCLIVFISTHEVSQSYPSDSLPHTTGSGVSGGAEILTGFKQWNFLTSNRNEYELNQIVTLGLV